MEKSYLISLIIGLSSISIAVACSATKGGWGQPEGILIPKPTLIPKLAAAFHDGKASIKLGHGKPIIHGGKGWGGDSKILQNGLGWGDYEYGYAVNAPYTKDVKSVYAKGIHGLGAKGGYHVNDGNSFKNVHFDTYGWSGSPELYGDFGKKK